MNKTLSVYVIKELTPNFILGFLLFLFVFFMTQIFKLSDLIVVHGVGLKEVTRLVTFVLLPFVGMTFPVALLFSVLISLGRMSQDSELIAMRAGGISLTQILKPIFVFSIAVYIFSNIFTIYIEPWGFRSFKKLVFDIGKSKISTGIQPGLFNEDFYDLVIYTDRIDRKNDIMDNILLYDERDSSRPITVVASEGKILSDPKNLLLTLRLFKGNLLINERTKNHFRKVDFNIYDINLTLDPVGQFSSDDPRTMTLSQISNKIKEVYKLNLIPNREIIEYHRRFAIPLACLIFAIISVGIAGSTRNPRFATGKGKAIVICMSIIVGYWLLSLMGQSYARKNILPAQIVMWIPNLLFLVLAAIIFKKATRKV